MKKNIYKLRRESSMNRLAALSKPKLDESVNGIVEPKGGGAFRKWLELEAGVWGDAELKRKCELEDRLLGLRGKNVFVIGCPTEDVRRKDIPKEWQASY